MSELISVEQLATEFKRPAGDILSWLVASNSRERQVKIGDAVISFYDKIKAKRMVRVKLADLARAEKIAIAAAAAAKKAFKLKLYQPEVSLGSDLATPSEFVPLRTSSVCGIAEVLATVKSIYKDLTILVDVQDSLVKIKEQNVLIFKELMAFKVESAKATSTLGQNISAQIATAHRGGGGEASAPAEDKKLCPGRLPRVGVIGLFAMHHAEFMKVYGNTLNLTLLNPDEAKKIDGLKGLDQIFLMVRHVSHVHVDKVKVLKVPFTNVPGTVNDLKTALMEYIQTTGNTV